MGQRRSPLLAKSPVTACSVRQPSCPHSPLLFQSRQIVYDVGLALLQNCGSAVYLAAAPQQKRAIHPMLAQRLQRWPDIETALGDFPVSAAALLCG